MNDAPGRPLRLIAAAGAAAAVAVPAGREPRAAPAAPPAGIWARFILVDPHTPGWVAFSH